MKSQARNVYMPDELWERIQKVAIRQSAKRGRVVSPSEYIREAVERRLTEKG